MRGRTVILGVGCALGGFLHSAIATAQPGARSIENLAGFSKYIDQSMVRVAAIREGIKADGYGDRLERLQAIHGTKPMRSIAYLTNVGGDVGRAILRGAAATGVDPTFLAVSMFQEGLNYVVDTAENAFTDGTYDSKTFLIDGFSDIGVDSFAAQMASLKARGYLRRNYDGIVLEEGGGTWTNEAGDSFPAFSFKGMDAAAEAVAAILASSRDLFMKDARELGVDVTAMSQVQRDQWTYLYYNGGAGTGKRLLRQRRGAMPKPREENMMNAYYNAARVGASAALYRQYGVFEPYGTWVSRNANTRPAASSGASSPGQGAGTSR